MGLGIGSSRSVFPASRANEAIIRTRRDLPVAQEVCCQELFAHGEFEDEMATFTDVMRNFERVVGDHAAYVTPNAALDAVQVVDRLRKAQGIIADIIQAPKVPPAITVATIPESSVAIWFNRSGRLARDSRQDFRYVKVSPQDETNLVRLAWKQISAPVWHDPEAGIVVNAWTHTPASNPEFAWHAMHAVTSAALHVWTRKANYDDQHAHVAAARNIWDAVARATVDSHNAFSCQYLNALAGYFADVVAYGPMPPERKFGELCRPAPDSPATAAVASTFEFVQHSSDADVARAVASLWDPLTGVGRGTSHAAPTSHAVS